MLEEAGSAMRYKNLLGITLGTGFGGGVVIDGKLLSGDNGCGGDVWLMRNSLYPELIAEESVSIRAVRRVYREYAKEDARENLTPKDIFDIAEGIAEGNVNAARQAFSQLGKAAADAIVHALDIIDGLVVIGGGLSGAAKYIVPAMKEQMRSSLSTFGGDRFPCLQSEVYDLNATEELAEFLRDDSTLVQVPGAERSVRYRNSRKTGIAVSSIGTSTAIALGAYAFALNNLNKSK